MADKQTFGLPTDELIILPAAIAEHLRSAGEKEIKMAIWLFWKGEYSAAEAARELGISIAEAEAAISYWKGAGVIRDKVRKKAAAAPSDTRPVYDAQVLADAQENDFEFRSMCETFAATVEKMLNRTDYNTLFYLYDYCRLSGSFICTVAQHCRAHGRTDMRYINGTVLSMLDEGIDTDEKLELHLAARERALDMISRVRTLFGMGERAPTTKEKECFKKWFEIWNVPFELVRLAYEKAVNATGKVSISYIDKVLSNWHEAGYTTAEEVAEDKKKKSNTKGKSDSFDADDFFESALEKSRREDEE